MRLLVLPLSALAVVVSVSAQDNFKVPSQPEAGAFYMPASLNKAIQAEKIRLGDPVHLKLDEPVLVGRGIVMPQGTQLTGHVTAARALEGERGSQLGILVESAEWKRHTVPLHAFISGLITVRQISRESDPRCEPGGNPLGSLTTKRGSAFSEPTGWECNGGWPGTEVSSITERGTDRKELRLRRNQDESTFLLSHKKNVHLPGGTLLMLKNVPLQVENPAQMISQK